MKKFTYFFLFLAHLSFSSEQDECVLLEEALKEKQVQYELDEDAGSQSVFDRLAIFDSFNGGIFFKEEISGSLRDEKKYSRNSFNNITIENIAPLILIESEYKTDDVIEKEVISINKLKVSELTDEAITEEIIETLLNNEILSIEIKEFKDKTRTLNLDLFSYPQTGIYSNIYIYQIGKLDPGSSTFDLNYKEELIWEQTGLEEIAIEVFNNSHLKSTGTPTFWCEFSINEIKNLNIFLPDLKLVNAINEEIIDDKVIFQLDYLGEDHFDAYWWRISEKTSSVKYRFNYRTFPFDSQKISLEFVSTRDRLNIVPFLWEVGSLVNSYEKLSFDECNKKDIDFSSFIYSEGFIDYLGLKLSFKLDRSFSYYLTKVFLPIFIILLVALSVLKIPTGQLESRLTVSVVCFLALIAYTYVVDKDVPKLAYLTIMDNMILLSYFFSALPTFQSIYVYNIHLDNKIKAERVNALFLKIIPVLYLLAALLIVLLMSQFSQNTVSAFKLF